jgi:hypothetical protein
MKKRYFTGKPCKHGHIAERYTASHACVVCVNQTQPARGRAYRKKHNNRWKVAHRADERVRRIKSYGLSVAEYETKLREQGGVCAICGEREAVKHQNGQVRRLAIDHNHQTGNTRDLLCSRCNTTLGKFNDNPVLFEKAAQYLRKHYK